MTKLWIVARQEFLQNVKKKSFILVVLSVPLYIALMILMVQILETSQRTDQPLGYVDAAGILSAARSIPEDAFEDEIDMIPFASEEQANAALQSGQIQAYFILPADYLDSGNVQVIYLTPPGDPALQQMRDFLQLNLLADRPADEALRAAMGTSLTVHSLQDRRIYPSSDPTLQQTTSVFVGLAFLGLQLFGSGYLLHSVFMEKNERTMEVMATSLSTGQFVWGKVLSVVLINLVQLAFWVLVAVAAVLVGGWMGKPWLQNPSLDWRNILAVLMVALPTYVMMNAFMFAASLMIATKQESESVGPLLFFLEMIPVYMISQIGADPNSTFALLMSCLPFVGTLTMSLRGLLTNIPLWHALVASAAQILYAWCALWLAGKTLQLGMLRYGKRLRLGEVIRGRGVPEREGRPA